jgi:hypothetical protein
MEAAVPVAVAIGAAAEACLAAADNSWQVVGVAAVAYLAEAEHTAACYCYPADATAEHNSDSALVLAGPEEEEGESQP